MARFTTKDYAIIASFEDGSTSVHYIRDTYENAQIEAVNTKLMSAAEWVNVCECIGFVPDDNKYHSDACLQR